MKLFIVILTPPAYFNFSCWPILHIESTGRHPSLPCPIRGYNLLLSAPLRMSSLEKFVPFVS